jgi:hypothetical protein
MEEKMAANPTSIETPGPVGPVLERYHVYHAEAHVLSGNLKHPIEQPIEPHGKIVLENTRRNGHITQAIKETTLEGLVSFKAGFTHASGSKIEKKDLWGNDHSGWVTLSTSVIEGLNVFEVITADRVVAQVSTEHSMKDGHIPKVTFLGTRFENLRVGGYPVHLELDLGICGERPKDDKPYLEDDAFLDRVEEQLKSFASNGNLPGELKKQYHDEIVDIGDFRNRTNGRPKAGENGHSLQCSLIKSIGRIPLPGVEIFGNVIFIPDFGTVSLAEVEVGLKPHHDKFSDNANGGSSSGPGNSNYFTLNMLNMRLGCIAGGQVTAGSATANGQTHP